MTAGVVLLAVALLEALVAEGKVAFKGDAAVRTREAPIVIKMPERLRTGRLGELTLEEEERIDRIIQTFIKHDLGVQPSPGAPQLLEGLGPEAIPGLVRGINQSANYSHSCPVTVLSAKLLSLIRRSDDPVVLQFIRAEVGTGVKLPKYNNLLNRLKAETSLRQAQLRQMAKEAAKSRPDSPGDKQDPGNNR